MNAQKEAQAFLDRLRTLHRTELGDVPDAPDDPARVAALRKLRDRFLRESLTSEQGRDPRVRAMVEQEITKGLHSVDDMFSQMLTQMQDRIEETAAGRVDGMDLTPRRPLIGHLRTGQLQAVSMRVPGRSGAFLVLFEDQMPLFASKLSKAVAWAIPEGHNSPDGKRDFRLSVPAVVERITARPEVADPFAEVVTSYAVTGSVGWAEQHLMPPGYFNFASILRDSLEYFVLGHEYAHILLGHLDTTAGRKGVLPVGEAEVLAYSWQQEFEADRLGMVLSVNAIVEHERLDLWAGFLGVGLFFDALDVMDRAVALLQTGDENARQLGSHPPSDLRKQRLRAFLPQMADATRVRAALGMADVQGEIIRLLWERTRPGLLDLHRRGVPATRAWQTIPKETTEPAVPAPRNAAPAKEVHRSGRPWRRKG